MYIYIYMYIYICIYIYIYIYGGGGGSGSDAGSSGTIFVHLSLSSALPRIACPYEPQTSLKDSTKGLLSFVQFRCVFFNVCGKR